MIKKLLLIPAMFLLLTSLQVRASEQYVIDTRGMHAFITFKIKHLGFSWLQGRFDKFSGDFSYDADNPANNQVSLNIDINSIDSNHAERDRHLKSERFFDADRFPQASFVSTGWKDIGNNKAILSGKFTLRGITQDIQIDVTQIGAGKDPWGGFRRGFEGTTTLRLADYKMKEGDKLGAAAGQVDIWLSIEGVRQK
jgi:polyisoprenoid-binding protein YceI